MFTRLRSLLQSPPLTNSGSLARDLLALERTYLAWSRTGLSLVALGVALEKVEVLADLSPTLLHVQDSRTRVAAGILVGSGSLLVGHGTRRYFDTVKCLKEGKVRVNTGGIVMTSVITVGLAVAGVLSVWEKPETVKEDRKS